MFIMQMHCSFVAEYHFAMHTFGYIESVYCADPKALDRLKSMNGFESVEWDVALASQNPHAIGVAVKAGGDSREREVEFERRATKSNRNKKQSVKTGFGKS